MVYSHEKIHNYAIASVPSRIDKKIFVNENGSQVLRKTDGYDATNPKFIHEHKMKQNPISYSGEEIIEFDKDILIMLQQDKQSIWHFLEGKPTGPLQEILEKNSIEYLIY